MPLSMTLTIAAISSDFRLTKVCRPTSSIRCTPKAAILRFGGMDQLMGVCFKRFDPVVLTLGCAAKDALAVFPAVGNPLVADITSSSQTL